MEKGRRDDAPPPFLIAFRVWLDASNCGSERNAQPEFDPAAALYAVRGFFSNLPDRFATCWIVTREYEWFKRTMKDAKIERFRREELTRLSAG